MRRFVANDNNGSKTYPLCSSLVKKLGSDIYSTAPTRGHSSKQASLNYFHTSRLKDFHHTASLFGTRKYRLVFGSTTKSSIFCRKALRADISFFGSFTPKSCTSGRLLHRPMAIGVELKARRAGTLILRKRVEPRAGNAEVQKEFTNDGTEKELKESSSRRCSPREEG
jgi:hypothetical protein